jgi:hypothetical protein
MTVRMVVDLRSQLAPVRDQGPRSTCLAHAATAAHEFIRKSQKPLSAEYLHFFAAKSRVPSAGSSFPEISVALERNGQPLEVDCPERAADPPSTWRPPTGVTVYRRHSDAKSPLVDTVYQLIKSSCVVVLGVTIPRPFYAPASPWVILTDGISRGRHAVLGVGVGAFQGQRFVLIRNSWGQQWGDLGHAWLDDAFLGQHLEEALVLTSEVVV